MPSNLDAILPALRDMLNQQKKRIKRIGQQAQQLHPELIEKIEKEHFLAEAALLVGADALRDLHRIADALEVLAHSSEFMVQEKLK